GIPLDPDLRKSEMARAAARSIAPPLAGEHARVAFLLPSELSEFYSTSTGEKHAGGPSATPSYLMLEGALDGGNGLRALLPNVDSVAFLPAWRPGYGEVELFS